MLGLAKLTQRRRAAEAVGVSGEGTEKAVAMRPNDPNTLYNAACTYGNLQMKQEALTMIGRAVETGFADTEWSSRDPDLACLHGDPEFERVIGEKKRERAPGNS
jgi:hypothetical protein